MTGGFFEVIDTMDAAIFTGDHLEEEWNRAGLRLHLDRWERELKRSEELASTINETDSSDEEKDPEWAGDS